MFKFNHKNATMLKRILLFIIALPNSRSYPLQLSAQQIPNRLKNTLNVLVICLMFFIVISIVLFKDFSSTN